MKYVYFTGAALCGLLAVCSLLSMTGILGLDLDFRDAGIGILGVIVGICMGRQIQRDEKRNAPWGGRLR